MHQDAASHSAKTVMLLGNSIPIPEITEKIVSMGHTYKSRNLFSNPFNWMEIEHEVNQYRATERLLAVFMFLSEGALLRSCSPEYREVWLNVIAEMKLTNSLIFTPQWVLQEEFYTNSLEKAAARREHIDLKGFDIFARRYIKKEEIVPKAIIDTIREEAIETLRMIKANGIEIIPYDRDKAFTIRAYRFLDDIEEGVFLKLYVPHGRYQADQLAHFLRLLENYLQNVEKKQFFIDVRKTGQGQIYYFRSKQGIANLMDVESAISRFESFMDLCQSDFMRAEALLKGSGFSSTEATSLLTKYVRDYQRLVLDIKHDYEQKTLLLRQRLESEAIEITNNNGILSPSPTDSPSALLSLSHNSGAIHITISNPSINTADSIAQSFVEEALNGNITYTTEDKKLIELFDAYTSRLEAISLKSELEQLKDTSSSPETRKNAKQKLIGFLYKIAPSIGQSALNLLSAYLQKVLLGQ